MEKETVYEITKGMLTGLNEMRDINRNKIDSTILNMLPTIMRLMVFDESAP
jgi:hypothetical protein